MPFRADEAMTSGYAKARSYLVSRTIDTAEKERSEETLDEIIDQYGPVIESYPTWHPLVRFDSSQGRYGHFGRPCRDIGYEGLDHTVYLAHGFVTCPYGDGQQVIESINKLPEHPLATITAERLDAQFYNRKATPILVTCNWERPIPTDRTIPKSWAVPLMLERELPCWRWSEVAETWETMRPDFLGCPHGSRSSLFVNQETGQAIKSIWNALIHTGMFGPIMV